MQLYFADGLSFVVSPSFLFGSGTRIRLKLHESVVSLSFVFPRPPEDERRKKITERRLRHAVFPLYIYVRAKPAIGSETHAMGA